MVAQFVQFKSQPSMISMQWLRVAINHLYGQSRACYQAGLQSVSLEWLLRVWPWSVPRLTLLRRATLETNAHRRRAMKLGKTPARMTWSVKMRTTSTTDWAMIASVEDSGIEALKDPHLWSPSASSSSKLSCFSSIVWWDVTSRSTSTLMMSMLGRSRCLNSFSLQPALL